MKWKKEANEIQSKIRKFLCYTGSRFSPSVQICNQNHASFLSK